jgi:AraC-like DNA-binding protein
MQTALFNLDDLSLLIVVASCLLFILILSVDKPKRRYNRWLSLFLLCVALSSLNTVLYWSVPVKNQLEFLQPHALFILRMSPLVGAPALYIYIRSLVFKDFEFSRQDFHHFLPAVVFLLSLPFIYLSISSEHYSAGIQSYYFYIINPVFWTQTWLIHITELVYGCLGYRVLVEHKSRLMRVSSNLRGIDARWLKILLLGFISLWLLQTTSQVFAEFNVLVLAHITSRVGTYFVFFLIVTLVVYSLTHAQVISLNSSSVSEDDSIQEYTEEQVNRLLNTMVSHEPFLNPDLSIMELSRVTSIPQRSLSSIINRHHGVNFFDYINEYRFKKAADLLISKPNNRNILDIMIESGFSSKSTFNRSFKKLSGMTPTQYQVKNRKVKSFFKG